MEWRRFRFIVRLDIVEQLGPQSSQSWPRTKVYEFFLDGAEEGFRDGVVVTNPGLSDRWSNVVLLAEGAEFAAGVLAATVGMEDHAGRGLAVLQGHVECVDDELGAHVVRDGPANYLARVTVDDGRQERPAGPGLDVGDVANPGLVWTGRVDVPQYQVNQVRGRFALHGGALVGLGSTLTSPSSFMRRWTRL